MKRKFFIIILILLSTNVGFSQSFESGDEKNIIGKWSVCSQTCIDCNGIPESKIMFYICWEIEFKEDKYLDLTLASGRLEQYRWEINGDTLILNPIGKEKHVLKTLYNLRATTTNNFIDLIDGKSYYTLIR